MFKLKYISLGLLLLFPLQVQAATEKAVFAGGCFWCMEKPFEQLDGVSAVVSGYTTGKTKNPTYKNYARAGH